MKKTSYIWATLVYVIEVIKKQTLNLKFELQRARRGYVKGFECPLEAHSWILKAHREKKVK